MQSSPHKDYGTITDKEDIDIVPKPGLRKRLGIILESRKVHILVLLLIILDILLVIAEIVCSLFDLDKTKEEVLALKIIGHISLGITCVFAIEVLLKFVAFGFHYFFSANHWGLHLLDAIVVFASLGLEAGLHGKQREVAGLLILFRLWRIVKITASVAEGIGEHDEERMKVLEKELRMSKKRIKELEQKLQSV
ncbi:voltage-gated hydrogen channel [Acrasis kona]|uniref:Voltage-gated hydrogen channel 1 n=1 Tax=Acrasis kona TaxID=1008807 RepID=A0AAW2YZQ8_9EUKA